MTAVANGTTNGELMVLIAEIRTDVAEIKLQTIRTNGRVSRIEVERSVEAALATERARVQQADLDNMAAAAGRRRWTVDATMALAGVTCGATVALLALIPHLS